MGHPSHSSLVVNLDDYDDPHDILQAVVVNCFAAGELPCAREVRLQRVKADAVLLPEGVEPCRSAESRHHSSRLAEGDGWLLHLSRWDDGSAHVTVLATSDELAKDIIEEVTRDVVEPAADDSSVSVSFWHLGCQGPHRTERKVAASPWADIARNYAERAREAVGQLAALDPSAIGGKLLLLHGPPGTGKTTALRSLAAEWRGWCDLEVVIDSERLFGEAGYLVEVLLGDRDDDDDKKRWRMLVLEDCDEMLRVDAKKEAGQALARLLNVTDGILGQGLRLLVALTTNEPLSRLHPAIVRPGRCLAEVHVDAMSRAEAAKWLGSGYEIPATGATLAELYAITSAAGPVRAPQLDRVSGTYL